MSIRPTLVLLLACIVSACASASTELTEQEAKLASSAGIDATIALRLKPFGGTMERLMALTPDYEEAPAPGIVISTAPKSGRETLHQIRSELAATEYRAYLSDDAFGTGPDKIAIVKTDDYGFLAIVRTDGINYDLEHAKVLERYSQWDKKYGLELVGAGQDWLEAKFTHPPSDWQAFAAEVYAFCPDFVDQGTGDIPALASEMKAGNLVYLWWD